MTPEAPHVEDLLRELAPQVLGALVRRHGQFDACEDAVQEALLAAALQWPGDGVPGQPAVLAAHRGRRRLVDEWRSESARRRREEAAAAAASRSIRTGAARPATTRSRCCSCAATRRCRRRRSSR